MKVDKLFAARQPRHHAGQAKELTLPEAQIGAFVGHLATTHAEHSVGKNSETWANIKQYNQIYSLIWSDLS